MKAIWHWIVGFMVWLSAEPNAIERERPAAAAAVTLARASMEPDRPARRRCQACDGKGFTVKNGARWKCQACNGCPDGQCKR
jgi:hypothetical protein